MHPHDNRSRLGRGGWIEVELQRPLTAADVLHIHPRSVVTGRRTHSHQGHQSEQQTQPQRGSRHRRLLGTTSVDDLTRRPQQFTSPRLDQARGPRSVVRSVSLTIRSALEIQILPIRTGHETLPRVSDGGQLDGCLSGRTPGPQPLERTDSGSAIDRRREERDLTKDSDKLIAGRRIIKLGHVAQPQMHVLLPDPAKANGAAVLVCPGGGFNILAWDLEGTEVGEWLNSLGYAAIVVKYRVPTGKLGTEIDETTSLPKSVLGPVADAQRAVSLTRSHAAAWKIDSARIGILGFSAGGHVAATTATLGDKRVYTPADEADRQNCAPNFALLIYPGGLTGKDSGSLRPHLKVTAATPPMFLLMAQDDRVGCENCIAMFSELQRAKVPAEIHVFTHGGHGYGLRKTETPVTCWSDQAGDWMKAMGFDRPVKKSS